MEGLQDTQAAAQDLILRYPISVSGQTKSQTYKCQECHDSGWIDIQDGKGNKYVKKCACVVAREAEARLAASGLADVIKVQTFDSFEDETPAQKYIKRTALSYVNALFADAPEGTPRPWFYVGGNPGCGKTHICTAICGEALKHNLGVRYMQWLQESRRLKALVNDEHFEDFVSEYINISVLYIDDLFKQRWVPDPQFTDADIKIVFTILNARYLLNKPTIISSEWNLRDQLLPADEGVFSRVCERTKRFAIYIGRSQDNNYRLRGVV